MFSSMTLWLLSNCILPQFSVTHVVERPGDEQSNDQDFFLAQCLSSINAVSTALARMHPSATNPKKKDKKVAIIDLYVWPSFHDDQTRLL